MNRGTPPLTLALYLSTCTAAHVWSMPEKTEKSCCCFAAAACGHLISNKHAFDVLKLLPLAAIKPGSVVEESRGGVCVCVSVLWNIHGHVIGLRGWHWQLANVWWDGMLPAWHTGDRGCTLIQMSPLGSKCFSMTNEEQTHRRGLYQYFRAGMRGLGQWKRRPTREEAEGRGEKKEKAMLDEREGVMLSEWV